jgi:hypothetical protein
MLANGEHAEIGIAERIYRILLSELGEPQDGQILCPEHGGLAARFEGSEAAQLQRPHAAASPEATERREARQGGVTARNRRLVLPRN